MPSFPKSRRDQLEDAKRGNRIEHDPLSVLIWPHRKVVKALLDGLIVRRLYYPSLENRTSGKWAIFHGKMRLTKLYPTKFMAHLARIKILGFKQKCWDNAKIYTIKKLP